MTQPLCSRCGGELLPILYGMPAGPPGPGVILGGCMVSQDDPMAQCNGCGYEQRAPERSLAQQLGLE